MWPEKPAVKNPRVIVNPPNMAAALCEKRLMNQLATGPEMFENKIECAHMAKFNTHKPVRILKVGGNNME